MWRDNLPRDTKKWQFTVYKRWIYVFSQETERKAAHDSRHIYNITPTLVSLLTLLFLNTFPADFTFLTRHLNTTAFIYFDTLHTYNTTPALVWLLTLLFLNTSYTFPADFSFQTRHLNITAFIYFDTLPRHFCRHSWSLHSSLHARL